MPLRAAPRSSTRLVSLRRLVVVGIAVLGAGIVGVGSAAPAFAVGFSFNLSSGNPDFGFVKAGTTQIRQFDILNDGDNAITIDPTPLAMLAPPFAADSISFSKTTVIPKNGHATFRILYSVPVTGTVSSVPVTLVGTDQTDLTTMNLPIVFKGTSISTDPAHFTATTTTGSSADFGTVSVGGFETNTVTLSVDGAVPLRFSNGDILITDMAGAPLPAVRITASSFGMAGANTSPGMTAAFELTYAPTSAGAFTGMAKITGTQVSDDPERSVVIVNVPLSGAASVDPTTPPTTPATSTATPAPTTPGSTSIPTVTQTAGTTGGSGHSGGTGGLAQTGLPVAGVAGLASIAGLLGLGIVGAIVVTRRRARKS